VKTVSTIGSWGMVLLAGGVLYAQPRSVGDCSAALSKDYYSIALKDNLEEDYLKTIDARSWQQLKEDHNSSGKVGYGGFTLDFSDSYDKFSESRKSYLESTHYHRSNQQALDILQITTSPRAYQAYEACLRSIAQGPAIVAWPESESMSEIVLRVRYVNAPGGKGTDLYGIVSGGSVKGESAGQLWGSTKSISAAFSFVSSSLDPNYWKGNEEKVITIQRTRGFAETSVTIRSSSSEPPVHLKFQRADGVLTLTYAGTRDVLRRRDVQATSSTPNNDHNYGHCPNEVGRHDGACVSRTPVTLTTSAPRFFQKARANCSGYPCGWTTTVPAGISPDGLTATGAVENWGSSTTAILTVDEYEHVGGQCGADEKLPVIKGQPVVFSAVSNECLPLAMLKWQLLGDDHSQGAIKFGFGYGPHGEVERVTFEDNGSVSVASYKLNK